MILILRSLPPGSDDGVSVPFDGVTGCSVDEGPDLVDGVVDPVDTGIVGPGPGGHPSMHLQWLFKLKVCQMISFFGYIQSTITSKTSIQFELVLYGVI